MSQQVWFWIATFPDPLSLSLSFLWSLSHLSIEWQKAKNKQIKHRYPSSVVKYISTPQWRAKYALYFTVLSRHLALTIPLSYSSHPLPSISCAILNIYISGFNSLVLLLFLLPGDRCCSSTWLHFKASSPYSALKVGRSTGNLPPPTYMFRSPPLPPPAALEAQEHQRPVGPCWVNARPPAKPPSGSLPSNLLSAPYSPPRTPDSLPPKSAFNNPCRNLTLPLTRTLTCICQYSWIQSWWCTVTYPNNTYTLNKRKKVSLDWLQWKENNP